MSQITSDPAVEWAGGVCLFRRRRQLLEVALDAALLAQVVLARW